MWLVDPSRWVSARSCARVRVRARVRGSAHADAFVCAHATPSFSSSHHSFPHAVRLPPAPPRAGYNDTLSQFDFLLVQMNVSYVDLVLNHWPTSPATPTVDPLCDPAKNATYDAKACRLSTWRAYVEIFSSGKARASGVAGHVLDFIVDGGMCAAAASTRVADASGRRMLCAAPAASDKGREFP